MEWNFKNKLLMHWVVLYYFIHINIFISIIYIYYYSPRVDLTLVYITINNVIFNYIINTHLLYKIYFIFTILVL